MNEPTKDLAERYNQKLQNMEAFWSRNQSRILGFAFGVALPLILWALIWATQTGGLGSPAYTPPTTSIFPL